MCLPIPGVHRQAADLHCSTDESAKLTTALLVWLQFNEFNLQVKSYSYGWPRDRARQICLFDPS